MVRVLSTVDPLLWQDEVYMSTYSIIDSAPSYTDYCVRPTNQSHENALFSLWNCKECSFEPRSCSESQLTRSRRFRNHLRKTFWIYKVYVLQIPSQFCCILVLTTPLENERPRHEASLHTTNIASIQSIRDFFIQQKVLLTTECVFPLIIPTRC